MSDDKENRFADLQRLLETKEDLHPDLAMCLSDGPVGPMLRHPLVYSVIHSPEMNAFVNHSYKVKMEAAAKAKAERNWFSFIWLHERPYRLNAFVNVRAYLHGKDYWEMVGLIWTDSENIWQNLATWKRIWSSKEPDRQAAMDEEELEGYRTLSDPISIYRGITRKSAVRGLSWTVEREKAIWFANRFKRKNEKAILLEAEIPRQHVMAFFSRESEIVVQPTIVPKLKINEKFL